MPHYKVFCYKVVEMAMVEVEATSHDVACEIALELFDHPDVHFAELEEPLDLAIKSPIDTVLGMINQDARNPEGDQWPED